MMCVDNSWEALEGREREMGQQPNAAVRSREIRLEMGETRVCLFANEIIQHRWGTNNQERAGIIQCLKFLVTNS